MLEGICTLEAKNIVSLDYKYIRSMMSLNIDYEQFQCPLAKGYAANAVFCGLIGPKRLFSEGSMYRPMLWFFLIGPTLPVIIYFLDKRFPRAKLKKVNILSALRTKTS